MSGTDVVQRTPQQELVSQVRSDQFRAEVSLALPENVTPERFVRVAITALQASPNIAELERASVIRSLMQSAAMGLMPDGREAAIVPFKGKAQLIPMIAGYRLIAGEYGWTIYTAIAYANDTFEYEQGLDVHFRHVPVRPGADRGEPIAAYAVGKHRDGRRELEVLTVEEVEKIRASSQSGQNPEGPWVKWWHQMAEKSAGKRLFKKLPLSEDDKRVRILSASDEPAAAIAALYGPHVDRQTGEILPAADDSAGGGRPAVSPEPQQAAEADKVGSQEPPSPPASAVPEDDDPEPVAAQTIAEDDPSQVVVPGGAYGGKTLAEIAALGADGEEYLAWMSRNAGRSSVGPVAHAALQRFRPGLFEAQS